MDIPIGIKLPHKGPVIGVGIDLVEIGRIRSAIERHGERFLRRVFTEEEQRYCFDKKDPAPSLAARFAAKEAVSKAFTTGIGAELNWTSIEVVRGSREEPAIMLDSKGQALLEQVGGQGVLISLTHTEAHAMAIALIIGK